MMSIRSERRRYRGFEDGESKIERKCRAVEMAGGDLRRALRRRRWMNQDRETLRNESHDEMLDAMGREKKR
jgi:hypothetical protein